MIKNSTKKKILIPNRGVIALDIIDSMKSIGLETILLHSPEDSNSLAVKMACRSYKFLSSKLEDSYMDREAIIEKALELDVDYIHPGYGFLAEDPEFFRLCEEKNIEVVGPGSKLLKLVENKIELRQIAEDLGIRVIKYSGVIKSSLDFEKIPPTFNYPLILKPLKGLGGKGIKVVEDRQKGEERVNKMLQREWIKNTGIFAEEYFPEAHNIEIPFIRDIDGNILFLPEIESSIQRRFQKIFQESPSVNISDTLRESLYEDSRRIIEEIKFVGLGYTEFLISNGASYFSEINPSYQINALIPEVHIIANFLKKQFAISNGELLHDVKGVKIVKPKYSVLLVSLMAENPLDNFQPSSGVLSEFFKYSTIRNIFKTSLYTGAKVSPLYDPYIGKIVTFAIKRKNSINDMNNFLSNIIIKGIRTNLNFLRFVLESNCLASGDTTINFLNNKCRFADRKKSEEEIQVAASLLSAAFHIDNRKKNYKEKLEHMKQPGFLRRLFKKF
ncbi:MAG: acetyl-CoA carboxylase biotin carboxylase subunit family protein [Acidobacteriota bacterium]